MGEKIQAAVCDRRVWPLREYDRRRPLREYEHRQAVGFDCRKPLLQSNHTTTRFWVVCQFEVR